MKPWGLYRKLQSGAVVLRQVGFDFVFFVESQVFGMGLQKVSCERAVTWITVYLWVLECGQKRFNAFSYLDASCVCRLLASLARQGIGEQ